MNFVLFEGERTLAALVERIYGELSAADRKRAQAALVGANPRLDRLADVTVGSLLVVPEVPGLRPRASRAEENPVAAALEDVRGVVDAYHGRLEEATSAAHEQLAQLEKLLKSRRVQAAIRAIPEARTYVDRVRKAADVRAAELEERRAFLDRLATSGDDLAALVNRIA